jgi:acetyl esterase
VTAQGRRAAPGLRSALDRAARRRQAARGGSPVAGRRPTALAFAMGGATRALLRLPDRTLRRLLRHPVEADGLLLAADVQLLLRLERLLDRAPADPPVAVLRRDMDRSVGIIRGRVVQPVATRELTVADRVPARLYEPVGLPRGRGLLIYYHGGGWVIGNLATHDNLCRFLALRAGVRVLSVDYRLAPEARFPAAVQDAVAAFGWAVEHAAELGSDAGLIGVGGDSAGGNLSAVVCQHAAAAGGPRPAFALLIYPAVDFSTRRRSRELFCDGYLLTDARMTWFEGHYLGGWTDKADPRLSPLLAADLSGMPPTYVVTAGFDPLRDEGEEFAKRLADAGVPVTLRRQDTLIHGFANLFNLSRTARAAMDEVVLALRDGLRPPAEAAG